MKVFKEFKKAQKIRKKFSVLVCSVLCILSCGARNANIEVDKTKANTPNILFVIADDMGLDATPGYDIGDVKPNMPNLLGLMNSGVKFNNLWAKPTCTPTRASIITGKYGFRTNVLKVRDILSTSEVSLQKYIDSKTDNSYANAVIGKWHLSNV